MKIDVSKIYGLYEIPEYGTVCKREKIINELKEKIQDKDEELNYLCEVIDALEEEKEELDSEYEELEEENSSLEKELKETKKVSEIRYDLLIKAVEEIEKKDKLIKELREENRKLTSENFDLEFEKFGEKIRADMNSEFLKAGSEALSNSLNFEESLDKLSEFLEKSGFMDKLHKDIEQSIKKDINLY
ncbi:hypothetical protein VBG99_06905 [Clostridium perfringens]|uniref:hypothetical protein n=1 Tax=Clostridium perfringens TaxID=1502 RepID=UPI00240F8E82|nr:hypothetical protein [Clostridium perfringens]WFD92083.1 hypothetical protein P7C80_15125 [Clostridium perfringens]